MTDDATIELIREAAHGDPFSVLGLHTGGRRRALAARLPAGCGAGDGLSPPTAPGAGHADACATPTASSRPLPADAGRPTTGCRCAGTTASSALLDDPYRFGAVLGEMDVWLMGEGTHLRPYEVLGATRARRCGGVAGTAFAVWAPNASRVSVVGDFNFWDGRRHPMRLRRECGVWEIFLPGVGAGARYKFELRSGERAPAAAEGRPLCAAVRAAPGHRQRGGAHAGGHSPASPARQRANALDAPMSIYEVHLGSWRRKDGNRWLTGTNLPTSWCPMPARWASPTSSCCRSASTRSTAAGATSRSGMYAPTSRFGDPAGFRRFVDRCHAEGLGLILDWVPAHFPTDAHGLANFDGTHLYEYADPREGFHQDWNTLIYNWAAPRCATSWSAMRCTGPSVTVSTACASMRWPRCCTATTGARPGEWMPNCARRAREPRGDRLPQALERGGRLSSVPQAVTLAEESTAFPAVSRPTLPAGSAFGFKWNMGWMHDTLPYMARDPVHRSYHHGEITFALIYAFNENFVLPISHDEVVHGKGSLLAKMPGDRWQRFANLRAYSA